MARNIRKSLELWQRAEPIIPCGTQTASKGPDQFVKGVYPIYLQKGKGSHVWDVDGNEYIDYPCSLGAIFLGHAYPPVVKAIQKQAEEGIIFSLMHPLEVELAELLIKHIPCAEAVRFAKNGSDATSAAVRIARAYTGKDKIAFCGYHGWQDWYTIGTEKTKGIPNVLKEYLFKFQYNNIDSLKKIFEENKGEIAAIIMEPVITEAPKDRFLEKVKELAHENGALLIFDEMVTGFRFGLGGAQKYFNVIPDLGCFGKSIANGMPLSVVAGRKEIMEECKNIFFSVTFGGEAISLAAAVATIKEVEQKDVIDHIWAVGKKFNQQFNALAAELDVPVKCVGFPPRQNIVFSHEDSAKLKTLFLQETIKQGVLIGNVIFFNYSHSEEDLQKTMDACKIALTKIKGGLLKANLKDLIEGELAGEVFRQRSER
ncbi:MAG TPA: aminotransferase class III-fold pyridoxal phosphate-dependent enzyme [Candidatus Nanoarchaeia archaeon]|nr:aminotransferase class III-fold pyridoxal phosphate-dependent enzyme [Candidatus Nanoarchaeia archaeon]